MKDIDADYYGYRDEDDGRVLPLEKEAEENGRFLWQYQYYVLSSVILMVEELHTRIHYWVLNFQMIFLLIFI